MNLLNAGCGTHYADGWVNTDTWSGGDTKPDVLVEPNKPYPFEDNHFDAVFLGHVLEHIPWADVPNFLRDMKRIAKPDAPFLVCGPDVFKTIKRWAEGKEPWHMVTSTMEHQSSIDSDGWNGAPHHWNCHHNRVVNLLEAVGFTDIKNIADVIPKNASGKGWENDGINWPVVGHWFWHFAVLCKNAK